MDTVVPGCCSTGLEPGGPAEKLCLAWTPLKAESELKGSGFLPSAELLL